MDRQRACLDTREGYQYDKKLLRTLSEANDSMVSTSDIEQIIAQQDSVVTQQRVQHRIITHRDTVVTRLRKKGFLPSFG